MGIWEYANREGSGWRLTAIAVCEINDEPTISNLSIHAPMSAYSGR